MESTEQMKHAVETGDVSLAKQQIDNGYAVDTQYEATNSNGLSVRYTALMQSADQGKIEVCKYLLESGANPNLESESGDTALFAAAGSGCVEAISLLVEHGAYVDFANKTGWTAMKAAAHNKRTESLKALVAAGAKLPSMEDVKEGWLDLGQYFDCMVFSNPNYFRLKNDHSETMLVEACKHRNLKNVNVMMKHGANPYIKDKTGRCAMDYMELSNLALAEAVEKNNSALAQKALDNGAFPGISYYLDDGEEALTLFQSAAARGNDGFILALMLNYGADVNAQDKNGNTVLHYVRDYDVLQRLLALKPDVNIRNKVGETPLFNAVRRLNECSDMTEQARVCNCLIDFGTDVRVKNKAKQRAVDLIETSKFDSVPPSLIARLLYPRKEEKAETAQTDVSEPTQQE